jgi:transcriptional regulator
MYVPKHFLIEDPAWIRAFMDEHRFATLVTVFDGEPFATHIPILYETGPEPYGKLLGHVARANPHWRSFETSRQLAIFTGPHAYVSPTWYRASGPAVPTWNYTAVHAYGKARILEEPAAVRGLLSRLTEREERAFSERYSVDTLDAEYVEHMMRQIVAFEIPLVRIEAKAKLNQNRPSEERRRVADVLGGDIKLLMEKLALKS